MHTIPKSAATVQIMLRMHVEDIRELVDHLNKYAQNMSRNRWIQEAIGEKIVRERMQTFVKAVS